MGRTSILKGDVGPVAVALKEAAGSMEPTSVAERVLAPGERPTDHEVEAAPDPSGATVEVETVPPPSVTWNCTLPPGMPLPY